MSLNGRRKMRCTAPDLLLSSCERCWLEVSAEPEAPVKSGDGTPEVDVHHLLFNGVPPRCRPMRLLLVGHRLHRLHPIQLEGTGRLPIVGIVSFSDSRLEGLYRDAQCRDFVAT